MLDAFQRGIKTRFSLQRATTFWLFLWEYKLAAPRKCTLVVFESSVWSDQSPSRRTEGGNALFRRGPRLCAQPAPRLTNTTISIYLRYKHATLLRVFTVNVHFCKCSQAGI